MTQGFVKSGKSTLTKNFLQSFLSALNFQFKVAADRLISFSKIRRIRRISQISIKNRHDFKILLFLTVSI